MKKHKQLAASRRLISIIISLSLMLSCILIAYQTQPAYGAETISGTYYYDIADSILSLVNKERADRGLPAFSLDADLQAAAMVRVAEISYNYSNGHTRPSGQQWYTVSQKTYAENLAYGYGNAVAAMNGWMNSELHKGNILSTEFSTIGIGVMSYNGTLYYTQEFGYASASLGTPVTGVQVNVTVDVMGSGEITAASFNPTIGVTGSAPTEAPTTAAPTTAAPTTAAPTTAAPTTAAPTTAAPTTTPAPTTAAPTIVSISASLNSASYPLGYQLSASDFNVVANMSDGSTSALSGWAASYLTVDGSDITIVCGNYSTVIKGSSINTYVPETTTVAPTTVAPTTVAPTTEAPTTEAPTTEAPTTEAPTTEEATTENATEETTGASYNINTSFLSAEHETLSVEENDNIVQLIAIDEDAQTALGIVNIEETPTICLTVNGVTYPLSDEELSAFIEDNDLLSLMLECSDSLSKVGDTSSDITYQLGDTTIDFIADDDGNPAVYITDSEETYRKVILSKLSKELRKRYSNELPIEGIGTTEAPTEETTAIETEEEPTTEETPAERTENAEITSAEASTIAEATASEANDTDNTIKSLFIAMIIVVGALTLSIIALIIVLLKRSKKDDDTKLS